MKPITGLLGSVSAGTIKKLDAHMPSVNDDIHFNKAIILDVIFSLVKIRMTIYISNIDIEVIP
tara:strand:+ start:85 stop:273 length:189 start_codon:yes stop_codon:yes gene_type:complete